jgi:hypothetical protein
MTFLPDKRGKKRFLSELSSKNIRENLCKVPKMDKAPKIG